MFFIFIIAFSYFFFNFAMLCRSQKSNQPKYTGENTNLWSASLLTDSL